MGAPGKLDLAGDGFFHLVDLLDMAKESGFPPEVPAPLDNEFSEIARTYRKAEPALRQQVREQLPPEYWAALLELGDRCAEWALVDKDSTHLEDGLTAYCLEDFRGDAHQNFMHLSTLWYAAKKLRADSGLFYRIGQFASPRGLQELSDFSARPEEAKSPRAMGLEAYEVGGHTHFRARRPKSAKPPGP